MGSTITGRNIYRCEKKEDKRLSPYIPLWLLATGLSALIPHSACVRIVSANCITFAGACMNIQRVDHSFCHSASVRLLHCAIRNEVRVLRASTEQITVRRRMGCMGCGTSCCVQLTNLFGHDIPLLLDIGLVLIERRFVGRGCNVPTYHAP